MKRPFEKVETSKLEFAIGVGRAGLKIWKKGTRAYKECECKVLEMESEVALRKSETKVK